MIVNVDFSSCFRYVASNFLMNRTDFCWWRQAFASYQTWLPQVWRKCFPSNFEHLQGVWENVFLYNFQYLCMVDVITIHVGRFYCLEDVNTLTLWQMLLPCFICCFFIWGRCFNLNIKYISYMNMCGRCYCLGWCYCQCFVVDVQTTEADVITSIVHVRLMLLPTCMVITPTIHKYWKL